MTGSSTAIPRNILCQSPPPPACRTPPPPETYSPKCFQNVILCPGANVFFNYRPLPFLLAPGRSIFRKKQITRQTVIDVRDPLPYTHIPCCFATTGQLWQSGTFGVWVTGGSLVTAPCTQPCARMLALDMIGCHINAPGEASSIPLCNTQSIIHTARRYPKQHTKSITHSSVL